MVLESNKKIPLQEVSEILVKDTGQDEKVEEQEQEQEEKEMLTVEEAIEAEDEESVVETLTENGQSTDTEDVLELGLSSSDLTTQSDRERSIDGDQRIGEVFRDENDFRSNRGGRGRGAYRGFRGHNKFQQMDRAWVPFQQQPFLLRGIPGPNGIPMMRPQQHGRMPLHGGVRGGPFGGPRPYFNNFMQPRPGGPSLRPRFFYQNAAPVIPDPTPPGPPFNNNPTAGNGGRKVLINPNFKGAVEAATNQLFKDQFYANRLSDVELQRQQQEFINKNLRCVEKRRHDRTPSPDYGSSRRFSKSPTPPPRRNNIRSGYSSRYHGNRSGSKDNDPAEDEETRVYRQQIESQKQKREEMIRQKEMRRKQVAEQKQKQTQPEDRLRPIIVTEKKIILKKVKIDESSPEKSSTPPRTILKPKAQTIADPQSSSNRRIVIKPSVGGTKVSKLDLVSGNKPHAITDTIKRKTSGLI